MTMATTTREQLHHLVDTLPESELTAAKRYLEYLQMTGGPPRELAEAPEDVEPLTPEEAAALAEADAQVARGELIPDVEFDAALARARHTRHGGR
jgi:hypothetical protein